MIEIFKIADRSIGQNHTPFIIAQWCQATITGYFGTIVRQIKKGSKPAFLFRR